MSVSRTSQGLTDRNYGLDVLKFAAMLMVIVLHILGHGGLLLSVRFLSNTYKFLWLLESFAFGAVNIFVIISGYVGCSSKRTTISFFEYHFQVIFYAVLVPAVMFLLDPQQIKVARIFEGFFPIYFDTYWFYTAFAVISLCKPFLNRFLNSLQLREHTFLLLLVFVLFSLLPVLAQKDLFMMNEGYSLLWMVLLYLSGGSIRMLTAKKRLKTSILWLVFFLSSLITYASKLLPEMYPELLPGRSGQFAFYASPTVVLAAASLVLIFKELKIQKKFFQKAARILAQSAFGVYLLQEDKSFRALFVDNRFIHYLDYTPWRLILSIFLTVCVIGAIGVLTEQIRERIFSLCGIKRIGAKMDALINRIFLSPGDCGKH